MVRVLKSACIDDINLYFPLILFTFCDKIETFQKISIMNKTYRYMKKYILNTIIISFNIFYKYILNAHVRA